MDRLIIMFSILLPVLGYLFMKITMKNVKTFIDNKKIDTGFYKKHPVYGDDVIPIARSFERAAKIFFAFCILMSFLFLFLLFMKSRNSGL